MNRNKHNLEKCNNLNSIIKITNIIQIISKTGNK